MILLLNQLMGVTDISELIHDIHGEQTQVIIKTTESIIDIKEERIEILLVYIPECYYWLVE